MNDNDKSSTNTAATVVKWTARLLSLRNHALLLCLAATMLVVGCSKPHYYVVEMNAKGDAVERKLICWFGGGPENDTTNKPDFFPAAELAAITKLYPKHETSQEGRRHTFTGEFRSRLPNDVGGHGTFTSFVTDFGSAFIYAERFRGNPDPAVELDRRLQAANQLADHLLGWFQAELGKEPQFEGLRQFLDRDVRHDFRNLTLYLWSARFAPQNTSSNFPEAYARCIQYLIERGYLKLGDLGPLEAHGERHWVLLAQRLVASKMGIPESQPVPPSLAFLADCKALQDSIEKYLRGTPAYRATLEECEKSKQTKPDTQAPQPMKVLNDLICEIMDFRLFETDDYLTVRLATTIQPIETNGEWKKDVGQVIWNGRIKERDKSLGGLPQLCYALWSMPDETNQKRRFGRVILTGEDLLNYGVWRHSLSPVQAGEWDALLVTLTPDNWQEKLKGFGFSEEARKSDPVRTDKDQTTLAEYPQQLFQPTPKPAGKR